MSERLLIEIKAKNGASAALREVQASLEKIGDVASQALITPGGGGHRVGAPVAEGASHRTVLVLFTYGSSGPTVFTPPGGRFSTSLIPAPA